MTMFGHSILWTSFGTTGAATTNPAAAPPPGASGPGVSNTTVVGEDGKPQEGAAQTPAGPFGDNFFMILIVVMVAVVGFSMFNQRKDKKRRAALIQAISKNDTVQTIGGMIGRVIELKPDTALLEVDRNSGSRVTVSRAALQQVIESSDSTSSSSSNADNDNDND
jgi:preprotein translocase subunit YajC